MGLGPIASFCTPRASRRQSALCVWRRLALGLVVMASLAACGQKGPLYLPQPEKPDENNEPAQR